MWYIIMGLIIIAIIYGIFMGLAELVGGVVPLIIIIVALILSFLAFSWKGVFAVVGAVIVIALLIKTGEYLKKIIKEHDDSARETARITQETQAKQLVHDNDAALLNELNKNCHTLGYMNATMWRIQLPNFVEKKYSSSFEDITKKFAEQMENQYILKNKDWFEVYKIYIVQHSGGRTVSQMLSEVNCPQLKKTHCTPNVDLLNMQLEKGLEKESKDIPALFNRTYIEKINEYLYTPTKYLEKLYNTNLSTNDDMQKKEINYDDL